MSELFIPKRIKVGYQKRNGTYTGQLAYVIYYDNKGVLRKETSWKSWRDEKIPEQEFDNLPQDGFCLNKDVKRFNWSHFGSNRSYIRIYDPRQIEFEITPENLIGILTETDCLKRGLEGKFVYAWKGTELVILPCNSEEYQKAVIYTERQDQNISAKELKLGCSYTTKKGEEVIYLGRFYWFEYNLYGEKRFIISKQYVFSYPAKDQDKISFFKKSDVKFLALLNSTDPVINYAELIDKWNADPRSSSINGWEFEPETASMEDVFGKDKPKDYPYLNRADFTDKIGDKIIFWSIRSYKNKEQISYCIEDRGSLNTKTMQYTYGHYSPQFNYLTKENIFERVQKSYKVNMILSNGKKVLVRKIDDIAV